MYIIKKDKIIENCNKYSDFNKIFYPVKANSSIEILYLLNPFIDKFLINNTNQFYDVSSIGVNPNKIAVMNPLLSNNDIKYLYNKGIRFFVFDDIYKLNYFKTYANMNETEISIRISTMEINNSVITNLGTDLITAKKMLYGLNNAGISFYLNPELKEKDNQCLIKMMELIKDVNNIKFLSVGGIPLLELNKNILINYGKENNIDVIIEPGKGLIENAVDLKTSVIKVNNNIITIRNGIFSGFLDKVIYNKNFNIDFIKNGKSILSNDDGIKIYLFGGSADSADKLGEYYVLENIDLNTEVIVKNVGTYFHEFLTNYDRKVDEYEIQDV